jgi:hypothetical protein
MDPLTALWQALNFLLPALGVALISAALCKLVWRRELQGAGFLRLALWSAAANALVLTGGLVLSGHDGRIATYAAMVVASSLALLWAGWGGKRR